MAFQIPEKLFQRIKQHLEREFVLGLIKEALNEAKRQAGVGPCEDAAPEEHPGKPEKD